MATIKQIAEMCGVSIGTVDRVLHNRGAVKAETSERVWQAVRELGYRPNHMAQGLVARKKNLKLGMLLPSSTGHPFFLDVNHAAREKAEELKECGVQVCFADVGLDYLFDTEEWKAREAEYLADAFKGVDGVAITGAVPASQRILARAKEKGIPVVLYNLSFPEADALAYVGCDYEKSGRMAAGLAALCAGEDARVCIYSEKAGEMRISSDVGRLQGFQKEMEQRYPNMRILDIRGISEDPIDNYLSAVDMFRQLPDVNLVYVINPHNYSICRAIHRADEKRQVRIITNDLVGEQIKMLREGIISATITQEPERQGAEPLDILYRYLVQGIVPDQEQCYTRLGIHIAQSI